MVGWYAWVGEGLRVQAGEEQRTTEPASTWQAEFEEPDLSERAWQLQERSVCPTGERNGVVGGGRSAVIIAAVGGAKTHHQRSSSPTMTKQRKGAGAFRSLRPNCSATPHARVQHSSAAGVGVIGCRVARGPNCGALYTIQSLGQARRAPAAGPPERAKRIKTWSRLHSLPRRHSGHGRSTKSAVFTDGTAMAIALTLTHTHTILSRHRLHDKGDQGASLRLA
jgi:hypothetical protein